MNVSYNICGQQYTMTNRLIAIIQLTFGNVDTRIKAIKSLTAIGRPDLWEQLTRALRDKDARVRQAAITALRLRFGTKAIDLLIGALKDEKVIDRMRAVDFLVQIGQDAISPLIVALGSWDETPRELAVQVLGRIGGAQTLSYLIPLVNDTGDEPIVRAGAIQSLAGILENDEDEDNRRKAADLLVQIGPEAVVRLRSALRRSQLNNKLPLIAQTLGRIGGELALEYVSELINNPREPVRQAASETLDLMAGRLHSKNSNKRLVAVKALGIIGGRRVVESLVQALEDEDPEVSWEAALALEKNPERNAIAIQVLALEQTKGHIPGVVYLLGQYGGPEVIDRLQKNVNAIIDKLNSKSAIERLAAVKALDVIGGSQAIEALLGMIDDPDDRVTYAVAKALARRGDATAIQAKLSEWEASDTGKKYKDNEAVNTLVAARVALNSDELRRYTEAKSEETHKNIRAQLETQLNKLLDRYSPDSFGG